MLQLETAIFSSILWRDQNTSQRQSVFQLHIFLSFPSSYELSLLLWGHDWTMGIKVDCRQVPCLKSHSTPLSTLLCRTLCTLYYYYANFDRLVMSQIKRAIARLTGNDMQISTFFKFFEDELQPAGPASLTAHFPIKRATGLCFIFIRVMCCMITWTFSHIISTASLRWQLLRVGSVHQSNILASWVHIAHYVFCILIQCERTCILKYSAIWDTAISLKSD